MPSALTRLLITDGLVWRTTLGGAGLLLMLFGSPAIHAQAEELSSFEKSLIEAAPDVVNLVRSEFPAEYSEILVAIQNAREEKSDLKITFAKKLITLRTKYSEAVFGAEDTALREVVEYSRHILKAIYASEGPEACGKAALGGPSQLSPAAMERVGDEIGGQATKVLEAIVSGRKNAVVRSAATEADWGMAYQHLADNQPPSVLMAVADADPSNPELCDGMIAFIDSLLQNGPEMERVRADFVYELAIAPVAL